MLMEAKCKRCGHTFNPASKKDIIHLVDVNGKRCGGKGKLVRIYSFRRDFR